MSDAPDANHGTDRRAGPGVVRLFAGMVLAPLAWALQVLIGYSVAARACYPTDISLDAPLSGNLRTIVGTTSVLLWVLLCIGCGVAWWNWRATRPQSNVGAGQIIQKGTGRPRFMALCGVIVSGLFAIGLMFTSVGIFWVPSCGA